ncbi:hypothetical protein TSUD_310890 [Trifolium subterraneum]|uniref:Alpha-1,3-mannosyl-glycoprotein 2-beta-N-acetylglucosaminyltransferase n=1 Tax=Trifolium subterraneum TaxID=3900 RepID=A0A2Z6NA51_TRISU|nr:hypothetical protein TSUD_310890 [Trifolium subterraneum]
MARVFCDFRLLLLVAAVVFIYIQMRLFATQSQYADRLAIAIEAENHCTSQMRSLIDQISLQQGRIVALEDERKLRDQECGQMKSLVQDLERWGYGGLHYHSAHGSNDGNGRRGSLNRKDVRRLIDKVQVPVAAVVIMACNRADYLERTINSVLKYQRSISSRFPLFVSQDGSNSDVKSKALSHDELSYMQVEYVKCEFNKQHSKPNLVAKQTTDYLAASSRLFVGIFSHLDFESVQTERPGELIAYYKIARHYKWALGQLFDKHNFSRVIILEDDMEIAPDFFDYFEAMATLLDKDKSIMAVSSWNDNGQRQFVHDPYTPQIKRVPVSDTRRCRTLTQHRHL